MNVTFEIVLEMKKPITFDSAKAVPTEWKVPYDLSTESRCFR